MIVTRGYRVDLGGKELTRTDPISFLAKPYAKRQLVGAVRASLDAR